jgi:hypothetical protein
MFKPKNAKKIDVCKKTTTTLDGKHKEMMQKLNTNVQVTRPKLEQDLAKCEKQLTDNCLSIEEVLDVKDRIKRLKKQIRDIDTQHTQYFLDNSSLIFDYFENKKKIADCSNKTTVLEEFFRVKPPAPAAEQDASKQNENVVRKYLKNVDESFLDINEFVVQSDVCRFCNVGELIPVEHEGILVCNKCSKTVRYLVENEKPSYMEPPKEVCFYAYKRINHFREILAQFQAKETTQIPEKVIEDISQQIKKERIDLTTMTNKQAKYILRKLGYNKYYEHIPFIKDKLGIKPPVMSSELEDTLCNLFMDIQAPYAKYCPDYRTNFLNYHYTVYKLCQLLGQTQFLPYFPLFEDDDKKVEQDQIWKNICQELDWQFIPTL